MSHRPADSLFTQTLLAPALLLLSAAAAAQAPRAEQGSTAALVLPRNERTVAAAGTQFVLSVLDGHLVFPNIQDFRNVVDDPDDATRESFLRATEELSDIQLLARSGDSALVGDAYFRSILNADGIVEIDEYIIKVLPAAAQVLVLRAADRSEYANLVGGDHGNPALRAFSADEDVLEQLEATRGGMMAPCLLGCKETGIGGCDKYSAYKSIPGSFPAVNMRVGVHYNKFGIYYSLFGQLEMGTTSNAEIKIDLEPVRYKPRCQSSVGPYNKYDYQQITGQHYQTQRWQSYQGSRALNEVHIRARGKSYVGGSASAASTTDWVEYRKNI